MPGTYNSNAVVEQLADVLVTATDAKNKIYARKLESGAKAYDDFKSFEGAEGSDAFFWIKRDLTKSGGDKMVFTVQSDLAGPGVRGEEELTGKTSTAVYSNYTLQLDFFRDAHEITEKEKKFLAAGADLDEHCVATPPATSCARTVARRATPSPPPTSCRRRSSRPRSPR
jgi:hypothetical protein